jgi:hypothetical protein
MVGGWMDGWVILTGSLEMELYLSLGKNRERGGRGGGFISWYFVFRLEAVEQFNNGRCIYTYTPGDLN